MYYTPTQMQAAILKLAEAREAFQNTDPATREELQKEYGEGTLTARPIPLNAGSGGDIVAAQLIAPVWDEERQGVFIPLLNLTIDAKNMDDGEKHGWRDARKMARDAGKRLLKKEEAVLVYWLKDAINAILIAHDGDLLDGWFWTETEHHYSSTVAWFVYFGSGYFNYDNKNYTFTVRAVAVL